MIKLQVPSSINLKHLYCKLFSQKTLPLIATNISIIRCQFSENRCAVLQTQKGLKGLVNLFIESLNASNNKPTRIKGTNIISINNMNVYFSGPIDIFRNYCIASVINILSCNITFKGKIKFDANYCKYVTSIDTY